MKKNFVLTALLSLVVGGTLTAASNNSFIETLAQQEPQIGFELIHHLASKGFEFNKLVPEDQDKIEQLTHIGYRNSLLQYESKKDLATSLLTTAIVGSVTSGLLWALTTYKMQGRTAQATGSTCIVSMLISAVAGVGSLSCLIPLYFAQRETEKAQQLTQQLRQLLHPEIKSSNETETEPVAA